MGRPVHLCGRRRAVAGERRLHQLGGWSRERRASTSLCEVVDGKRVCVCALTVVAFLFQPHTASASVQGDGEIERTLGMPTSLVAAPSNSGRRSVASPLAFWFFLRPILSAARVESGRTVLDLLLPLSRALSPRPLAASRGCCSLTAWSNLNLRKVMPRRSRCASSARPPSLRRGFIGPFTYSACGAICSGICGSVKVFKSHYCLCSLALQRSAASRWGTAPRTCRSRALPALPFFLSHGYCCLPSSSYTDD